MPVAASPCGAADRLRRAQDIAACDNPGGVRFLRFGIFARRNDGTGTLGGNGIMALARTIGTIGCDAGDPLLGRGMARADLLRRLAQRNRIEPAGSKLIAADAQQFLPQVAVMMRRDAAVTSLRCRY